MPKTSVSRLVKCQADKAWSLVGDPGKLQRWWPRVERIDRPAPDRVTRWVISGRGRAVAMEYALSQGESERCLVWSQQVIGTPFAKSVRSSTEIMSLETADEGTVVTLSIERKLKGTARLGAPLVARAQRQELIKAMDSLEGRLVRQ